MNAIYAPEQSSSLSTVVARPARKQLRRFSASWLTPGDGHRHVVACDVSVQGDDVVLRMQVPGATSLEDVQMRLGPGDAYTQRVSAEFEGGALVIRFHGAAGRRKVTRD